MRWQISYHKNFYEPDFKELIYVWQNINLNKIVQKEKSSNLPMAFESLLAVLTS